MSAQVPLETVFLLVAVMASAALGAAAERPGVVNAADFARADSPTAGLQEAVDALPKEGGVVNIPPGTYLLRRALVLRSHVTLRGSGSTTILTRGKQAHTRLAKPARKGEMTLEVESTDGFRPGDEVALMDDPMHGWYMAHCIVKEVAPKRLTVAEPIVSGHDEGVFKPERNAIVVNFFPFIRGGRAHWDAEVADVAILDLVLDGNLKENPGPWRDFTLAAIHFANVSDSLVRGVTIRGSVGDGIGVQGGHDDRVESCLVEGCRGHGLHPGTSLRGAVFANNISRRNEGDGLYFCWEVVGITVSGNLFHDNTGSGVGGLGEGGKGGDRFNVVANNVCRRNARRGIEAVRGANNVITGNVCLDNSQSKPGQFSGILLADTTHTLVSGNRCGTEGDKPTQKFGIEECGKSDHNVVAANLCEGNAQGGIAIVGRNTQATGNVGPLTRPQGK